MVLYKFCIIIIFLTLGIDMILRKFKN